MSAASLETRPSDALRKQSFFREINDRIAGLSQNLDVSPRFICECPCIDCDATIVLSLEEYAEVPSDPARFIVIRGHEDAGIKESQVSR